MHFYTNCNREKLMYYLSITFLAYTFAYFLGYREVYYVCINFLLILFAGKNKFSLNFIVILFSSLILYLPIGLNFGALSAGYVISAMQTDISETWEFIGNIGLSAFFLMGFTLYFLVYFYDKSKPKNIRVIYFLIFIIFLFYSAPIRFLSDALNFFKKARADMVLIIDQSKRPDDFHIVESHKKYKNIIVIIGESVSREYMSVNGYPLNTTPWLKEKATGYFFNQYISTAPNTAISLPRTLAISDGKNIQMNNNIVALVKKSGYETFWLSNQGYIGKYDTPVSIIGAQAQNKIFLKKGEYNSENIDDFELLKYLKRAIKSKNDKVIFMHMMGSHPNTCMRLQGYPIRIHTKMSKSVDCYLASLSKLDTFLKETNQILESARQPYAIFYFSDHGLTIDKNINPIRHANNTKQNYNIPFFIFTSDKKDKTLIDYPVSAFDFLTIFQWTVGIRSNEIPFIFPYKYDKKEIKVFNGKTMISYKMLKNEIIY
ncbi:phosphoethanolamine transferase [Acinetobacter lactucae]|uniref:phosphoethanolamine transferase n=1 Tax=Acinetobacter lactucae TaxID=1785128 RepID=UPI0021CD9E34|nr:phosphoethanolamine transferase [Acinetobacter lactucae]MCU4348997.1 phosphoethanolamine transferase [Acinetobacter lactucae]